MRIKKNRLILSFVTVVALSLVLGITVYATPQMDMEQNASLTICYDINKTPVSGVEFRLYRVADISPAGTLTATEDFAGYSLSFDALTSDDWTELAGTLEGYVLRDQPAPVLRGKTDEQGTIFFPDCAQGLYLLVGDTHTLEQHTYTPQSLLVSLPSLNKDGSWNYDVISEPKFSSDDDDDDSSDTPDSEDPSDTPDSDGSDGEKLPQTGMLKWPIPVMFLLGTGVFLAGYFYRRKAAGTGDKDEQKE